MNDHTQDDDNTRSSVVLSKGTMVSHYRIVEKIGAGGMGEVYLAQDTELDRKVALKFLPSHLCQDEDCRARFKREAQAAAKLSHPNIVTIHEVGEFQGRPYFVMEHVEGKSLKDIVKQSDLSIDHTVNLVLQICEGLGKAHLLDIVHRDVKPSNVVIDADGRPKLLDFGLAAIKDTDQITKTGSTLGTVGYMSPEQVQGKETDLRSDLFSLGILLYEMVTGRLPFKGESEAATMNLVLNETPEPLSRYKSGVSGKLQAVVSKLLEKDPSLRYQSAAGVISDLKAVQKDRTPGSGSGVSLPSLAVLPFANLSADPEQEYFCDGMAEEIINAMTQVQGLRVVARTSCFVFKNKQEDIREIGRKLGVDHVLEGSVRKAGNRIRVTGQLIKVSDGYHLWSDKFDRELEDIFEIQDEISSAIAQRLKVELLSGGRCQAVKPPTSNIEAYNLYLKGRFFWNKRATPELIKATECFEQAIQCDPEFALGYAGLADAYVVLADYEYAKRRDHLMLAEKFILKALELDDTLAEPHAALAMILGYQWKRSEADAEFKKALELNPHYATAHHWYGFLLIAMRRFEQAEEHFLQARELDPLSPILITAHAFFYYATRQYDRAIATCREGNELGSNFVFPLITGWALIEKGEYSDAIDQLDLAIAVSAKESLEGQPDPDTVTSLGRAYALAGETEKAREILHDCIRASENNWVPLGGVVTLLISLGDEESAFEWLERCVRNRDDWFPLASVSPAFDSVRGDPRFVSVMTRIGLDDRLPEVSHE